MSTSLIGIWGEGDNHTGLFTACNTTRKLCSFFSELNMFEQSEKLCETSSKIAGGTAFQSFNPTMSPVSMTLVNDNIAQVCQQAGELLVHRQQALMQHVWIGDQHLSSGPDLASVFLRGMHQDLVLACLLSLI